MPQEVSIEDQNVIRHILERLPENKLQEIAKRPDVATQLKKWRPNAGPQTMAYYSEADCLLYGGEPGGGKSQLVLGLAFNEHQRTFIMRREYGQLERLIDDALVINGSREGFNGSPPPRLVVNPAYPGADKVRRIIHFRAAQYVGDEQATMGQGRDLLAIDEATQFAESQVRFLMGWVRTEDPKQRTRTILATNPPLSAEGLWVIKMFAPWLDDTYPNPAKPGELRWVVVGPDGEDIWVDGPDDAREFGGDIFQPTSRTYIPAALEDNPDYVETGYKRQLDSLEPEIREQLMGGFKTNFRDRENQVIPTHWVRAAQARWTEAGRKEAPQTAMGLDPAGGGKDRAPLAIRHGDWYDHIVEMKGVDTANGGSMAAAVIKHRRGPAPVVIDMGGGYGGDVLARLKENRIPCSKFDGTGTSTRLSNGGFKFKNKRAEAYWLFREALNPDQEGGSKIALPPDRELLAELTCPTFEVETGGIQLVAKAWIRKTLGRSPDKADAVVMAYAPGDQAVRYSTNAQAGDYGKPQVNLGYANAKRYAKPGRVGRGRRR